MLSAVSWPLFPPYPCWERAISWTKTKCIWRLMMISLMAADLSSPHSDSPRVIWGSLLPFSFAQLHNNLSCPYQIDIYNCSWIVVRISLFTKLFRRPWHIYLSTILSVNFNSQTGHWRNKRESKNLRWYLQQLYGLSSLTRGEFGASVFKAQFLWSCQTGSSSICLRGIL